MRCNSPLVAVHTAHALLSGFSGCAVGVRLRTTGGVGKWRELADLPKVPHGYNDELPHTFACDAALSRSACITACFHKRAHERVVVYPKTRTVRVRATDEEVLDGELVKSHQVPSFVHAGLH